MRAVSAKIVLIDEADALVDSEGDVVAFAEARSLTFKDRRTVIGGTPLLASTSRVARELRGIRPAHLRMPLPELPRNAELRWPQFQWEPGQPDSVRCCCPHCGALHARGRQGANGQGGPLAGAAARRRRARKGLPNERADPELAACDVAQIDGGMGGQRGGRRASQGVLTISCSGRPGPRRSTRSTKSALAAQGEGSTSTTFRPRCSRSRSAEIARSIGSSCPWSGMPRTASLSCSAISRCGAGPFRGRRLDRGRQSAASNTGGIRPAACCKVDAAAIDSGGQAGVYDVVMKFCNARLARRVMACKGQAGWSWPAIVPSKTKKGRLFITGVDVLKTQILTRLQRGQSIRFSHTLDAALLRAARQPSDGWCGSSAAGRWRGSNCVPA